MSSSETVKEHQLYFGVEPGQQLWWKNTEGLIPQYVPNGEHDNHVVGTLKLWKPVNSAFEKQFIDITLVESGTAVMVGEPKIPANMMILYNRVIVGVTTWLGEIVLALSIAPL